MVESLYSILFDRINYERTPPKTGDNVFKLESMRALLARLGNPHHKVRAIHVAGTKGKGSTSTMIASILARSGFRVGLYTSPHLECISERFSINGKRISQELLSSYVHRLLPHVEAIDTAALSSESTLHRPTFFEITTALAFWYFAEQQTDIVVLEVGMGGRLDSTNVCEPLLTLITSISFDHMAQLGNTLAAIASEKAGIVKAGVPMICGVQDTEPKQVIESKCRDSNAPLFLLGRDFGIEPITDGPRQTQLPTFSDSPEFHFESTKPYHYQLRDLKLSFAGKHQLLNAALAIQAAVAMRRFGTVIPEEAIRAGLREAHISARIEQVRSTPLIVLDVGHNEAAIKALIETIQGHFTNSDSNENRKRWLVFASSRDKEVDKMLGMLLPHFDQVILTRFVGNPRAVTASDLANRARNLQLSSSLPLPQLHEADSPELAVAILKRELQADDFCCITGSTFIAGEMRPLLDHAFPKN